MSADSIVVGLGEVGGAVKRCLEEKYDVVGVDLFSADIKNTCKFLNICIPYSEDFVNIVNDYVARFCPELTIIHSTVPIGTTKKIKNAVHSPVRGKHPQIYEGLKAYVKYVGVNNDVSGVIKDYLGDIFKLKFIYNSDITEAMKLVSLAKYCAYLGIADETKEFCNRQNIDYGHIQDWDRTQNEEIDAFYKDMRWPILNPTNGKVGGHCVMPVSEMYLKECKNVGFYSEMVSTAHKKYSNI